jgi:hypothetical protein
MSIPRLCLTAVLLSHIVLDVAVPITALDGQEGQGGEAEPDHELLWDWEAAGVNLQELLAEPEQTSLNSPPQSGAVGSGQASTSAQVLFYLFDIVNSVRSIFNAVQQCKYWTGFRV